MPRMLRPIKTQTHRSGGLALRMGVRSKREEALPNAARTLRCSSMNGAAWRHTTSVARNPLRFESALTHGYIASDERTLWLRARSNVLYEFDLERLAVRRTIGLDPSEVFVGFLCATDGLRALVVRASHERDHAAVAGAWLVSLEHGSLARNAVCIDGVWAASIAPDHRSAALITERQALVVIDRDGARVHVETDPRLCVRSRVFSLTEDRVVLCADDGVAPERRDARDATVTILALDRERILGAVDREHLLVLDDVSALKSNPRSVAVSLHRSEDGAFVSQTDRIVLSARTHTPSLPVATREGTTFSLRASIRSLLDPSREQVIERSNATLAFSERWIVCAGETPADGISIIDRAEPRRMRKGDPPVCLLLSPDGTYLFDANFGEARVWHTNTGAQIRAQDGREPSIELIDFLVAPRWLHAGTSLIVAGFQYEREPPGSVFVIDVTSDGLLQRPRVWFDPAPLGICLHGFSPAGRCTSRSLGSPNAWLEHDYNAPNTARSLGVSQDDPLRDAWQMRYAHDGAIEAISNDRWWRMQASGWVELAPQVVKRRVCFEGPGVRFSLSDDPDDADSEWHWQLCAADGRAWPAPDRECFWASDRFVCAGVADGALWIADLESRSEWTIERESDWFDEVIDRVQGERTIEWLSLSADGTTLAVLDGPVIKIYRRDP